MREKYIYFLYILFLVLLIIPLIQNILSFKSRAPFNESWPTFRKNFYRLGGSAKMLNVDDIIFVRAVDIQFSPMPMQDVSLFFNSDPAEKILDKNDTFDPSPIFVDLDGDGIDEVITYFAFPKDNMHAVRAIKFKPKASIEERKFGNKPYVLSWDFPLHAEIHTSFAASDLNEDGKVEIIFGSDDGNLYVLNEKGNLIFTFKTNDKIRSSPAIEDIDFDGKKEIIFGSDDGNLYVLNNGGEKKWTLNTNGKVESSPTVITSNNKSYIIFGSDDSNLYVTGNEGNLICKFPTNGKIRTSPLVNQGKIIFGSDDGNIYIINLNCDLIKKWKTNGRVRSSPTQLKNGLFALGSEDGNIYFFNESYIENISLGSPILSTPVSLGEKILAANIKGGIYLLSPNQKIYIRKEHTYNFSCSLAVSYLPHDFLGTVYSCLEILYRDGKEVLSFFLE